MYNILSIENCVMPHIMSYSWSLSRHNRHASCVWIGFTVWLQIEFKYVRSSEKNIEINERKI